MLAALTIILVARSLHNTYCFHCTLTWPQVERRSQILLKHLHHKGITLINSALMLLSALVLDKYRDAHKYNVYVTKPSVQTAL
jgi:hypothetical protein